MALINNFIFTLSTFTKIPTPEIEYNEENTKYVFFFLPFIGLILGLVNFALFTILNDLISEKIIVAFLLLLININLTGGIHMDGYIDSMDAFKSYRSLEDKKRIIKDPNVGAFGLIHYISILLVYLIGYFYLAQYDMAIIILLMPIISRTVILFIVCNNDREPNDMLENLISPVIEKSYLFFIVVYFILTFILTILLSTENVALVTTSLFGGAAIYAIYFSLMYKRHFKAMSGDLCGYYIVMAEAIAPLVFIIFNLVFFHSFQ